ncbi:MAG: hypothetical protein KAJ55_15170, partial [Anaerolineales bacterium]|nr:hypothetical protein [Anaerolineales bacterium]
HRQRFKSGETFSLFFSSYQSPGQAPGFWVKWKIEAQNIRGTREYVGEWIRLILHIWPTGYPALWISKSHPGMLK